VVLVTDAPQRAGVIAVGVDGSASSVAALRWAALQARATGAALLAVTSWHYPNVYGYVVPLADDWRPDQEAARIQADALAGAADVLDGTVVESLVTEGQAAAVLVDASKQVDLLVVGSRGHGELTSVVLGSVSEYCAAHSECPVVVVRAHHLGARAT
jgi:nucleotide-binding universal stress UspA family protein